MTSPSHRPPPDLARSIATRVARVDRSRVSPLLRFGLAGVALIILVSSIPELVTGRHGEGHGDVHAIRHLGAFTIAYAVGLLLVAARPARARTMLPVSVALGCVLVITAIIDIIEGHTPAFDETLHLPELVSVLLIWLIARATIAARPPERPENADGDRSNTPPPAAGQPTRADHLRAVE